MHKSRFCCCVFQENCNFLASRSDCIIIKLDDSELSPKLSLHEQKGFMERTDIEQMFLICKRGDADSINKAPFSFNIYVTSHAFWNVSNHF